MATSQPPAGTDQLLFSSLFSSPILGLYRNEGGILRAVDFMGLKALIKK